MKVPSLLRRPPAKYLAWLAGLALLLAFPDMVMLLAVKLFHIAGYLLHFLIGWLEVGLKHLVHWAFDVSRHTAQIITAWIGLFASLLLLVWLLRRFIFRAPTPQPDRDDRSATRPPPPTTDDL